MGTQTKIARTIHDVGGHYVLALKDNWPATHAEMAMLFDNPPPGLAFESHETVDCGNGRLAVRRHTVCTDVDWMSGDRRYSGEPIDIGEGDGDHRCHLTIGSPISGPALGLSTPNAPG